MEEEESGKRPTDRQTDRRCVRTYVCLYYGIDRAYGVYLHGAAENVEAHGELAGEQVGAVREHVLYN